MKALSLPAMCSLAVLALTGPFFPRAAEARKPYKNEFDAMYVTPAANPAFAKAAEAAKCNICHTGEKKENRNAYGKALAKLLKQEKDPAIIKAALQSVAKEPSDPANAASPTFDDIITAGKLPGG